jgi:hypothetical protein
MRIIKKNNIVYYLIRLNNVNYISDNLNLIIEKIKAKYIKA